LRLFFQPHLGGAFLLPCILIMKKPSKQQAKFSKVMREFYSGKLKSSSGAKVTGRAQAAAIAASESGMPPKKKRKPAAKKRR